MIVFTSEAAFLQVSVQMMTDRCCKSGQNSTLPKQRSSRSGHRTSQHAQQAAGAAPSKTGFRIICGFEDQCLQRQCILKPCFIVSLTAHVYSAPAGTPGHKGSSESSHSAQTNTKLNASAAGTSVLPDSNHKSHEQGKLPLKPPQTLAHPYAAMTTQGHTALYYIRKRKLET